MGGMGVEPYPTIQIRTLFQGSTTTSGAYMHVLWPVCRECRAVISHLPYIQKNLCLYPSRIGFKTSIIFLHLLHKNKLIIHMFSYPGGPTAPSFQWEIVHICGLLSISLEYTHTHTQGHVCPEFRCRSWCEGKHCLSQPTDTPEQQNNFNGILKGQSGLIRSEDGLNVRKSTSFPTNRSPKK
jgi:hypothetical protein